MSFIADKQTIEDLNLLGKYNQQSVFNIFNKVKSRGGERLLQQMFQSPLTDHAAINERACLFSRFMEAALDFPFQATALESMDSYLSGGSGSGYMTTLLTLGYKKFSGNLLRDESYTIGYNQLQETINLLKAYRTFLNSIVWEEWQAVKDIFSDTRLTAILNGETLTLPQVARYGFLLKNRLKDQMDLILESLYKLDVCIAVGNVARQNNYCFGVAEPGGDVSFNAVGLRHPGLPKGIGNDLQLNQHNNMIFLTGSNMAGKSTFMKSFGISFYLAHMGFPVAATTLAFSVCDGLFSSINVSDNLSLGYSHFYAEVLRVKTVALEVSKGKKLVVLFDELFKGTNVKDAYDGTLAVTAAFSKYETCMFIVSTHITEAGGVLAEQCKNIRFTYFATEMNGKIPSYTYRLKEGVTVDRHGMRIIENEGIIDLIRGDL